MTTPRLLVLRTLLHEPGRERYGLELAGESGLEPGTIYPILVAFEGEGWLSSRAEDVDVHRAGRPRRRYYRLTARGVTAAREATTVADRRRAQRPTRRGLAW
jgi:DNA-binding PadR family transcriptional regulator